MEEEIYFEIIEGVDIIRIEPLRLVHANAQLDWDKNWIHTLVKIKAGGFQGEFNCDLMTIDFELFKRELKLLYTDFKAHAEFKTLERQIRIQIEGDGLGNFAVDCEVMDEVGIGNRLNIALTFDQTQIAGFIKQLNNIIQSFPIQGTELNIRNE